MVLLTVFGIQQRINMANWTLSESSVATTVSSDVVLTITPNSGYVVAASNFKIGGASNTATNEWTGGNVDIGVNKVTFADTGTANTVGNTVTATVNFDETDSGQSGATVGSSITLEVYPEGATSGDTYFSGTAFVTGLTINSSFDGIVESELSFQGSGGLTRTTV